jgi:hypothetical protein
VNQCHDGANGCLRPSSTSVALGERRRVAAGADASGAGCSCRTTIRLDVAGVDSTVNPVAETAEQWCASPTTRERVRSRSSPRVLDIAMRPDSRLAARPLAELPAMTRATDAIAGRGVLAFPHGEQRLRAADRVIVLVERRQVARALVGGAGRIGAVRRPGRTSVANVPPGQRGSRLGLDGLGPRGGRRALTPPRS